MTPYPKAPRPLVFAHRGYSAGAPENTLAAFRLAQSEGIPGIELDVQLTADGEVVVIHDFDLRRVAGVRMAVSESNAKEIRALDAGSWFSPQFAGEGIPLLREVFDVLGDSVYYDVELKQLDGSDRGLEDAVAKIIAEYSLGESAMISSFNPDLVRRFKEAAPGIPVASIFSSRTATQSMASRRAPDITGRYDALKPHFRRARPILAMTRRTKVACPVITWTVNSVRVAKRLLRIGVEGIISDDPAPIRRALAI